MKIFNKKNIYTIVTDKETNIEVQKFVSKHCMKHTTINITSATDYVFIEFVAKERRDSIIEQIKDKFEQIFNIETGENLIWITNK